MINDLYNHLAKKELIPPHSSLVLAVSGGIDSVAMLDMMSKLAPQWGWDLYVAHLDHNLRGDSSEDAKLVARLADDYGHQFFLNQLTEPERSEAALRRARYAFLELVRDGVGADYIVTAHHADDRLETAIFNSIRGADRYGLTAMRAKKGKVVRPLLPFSKGQLITYVNTHELPYRHDTSNDDVRYSRNFIRHHIIPQATVDDPDFTKSHLELINQLDELRDHIDWQLAQLLDQIALHQEEHSVTLRRDGFLKLSPMIANNLLSYIVRKLTGGVSVTSANLAQGLSFLQTARPGARSNALPSLIMERVYDSLVIAHKDSKIEHDAPTLPLHSDKSHEYGNWRITVNTKPQITQSPNYLIKPSTLYIRGWQAGDRIAPLGMTGTKKLQDVFTDKKIPRSDRAHWPIIVDARNQPIAAAGLVLSRDHVASIDEPHYQIIFESL